jgi:hypothetical protein
MKQKKYKKPVAAGYGRSEEKPGNARMSLNACLHEQIKFWRREEIACLGKEQKKG